MLKSSLVEYGIDPVYALEIPLYKVICKAPWRKSELVDIAKEMCRL
jgi:hypothetical protein